MLNHFKTKLLALDLDWFFFHTQNRTKHNEYSIDRLVRPNRNERKIQY